jgi:hypothetical protein
MFANLISFPIQSERLEWSAREVLRDLSGKPHLFWRVKMTGTQFDERALPPYVSVGGVRSIFAVIAPDGLSVSGYFDRPLRGGVVEFGYHDEPPLLRSARRFEAGAVSRLDRARLPPEVANIERFEIPR